MIQGSFHVFWEDRAYRTIALIWQSLLSTKSKNMLLEEVSTYSELKNMQKKTRL